MIVPLLVNHRFKGCYTVTAVRNFSLSTQYPYVDEKKISYFLQNLLFIWCWDFVVVSLNQPWDFWPKNTIPTKWFAVNVMLVFIPEPPIVVRRNADTPPTSDPRRSWSNLYIFFREIIFHENFRVNATIKVEDSLCQKILRKCLNLFPCDEVLGETFYRVRHKCQARNNIFFQSNPVKKGF